MSVLFAVSCGDGATSTLVPDTGAAAAETAAAEAAAAEAAAAAAEAVELAKYGGTLTVGVIADHSTLDPAFSLTQIDISIIEQAYDNLIMVREDLSFKPELATSWEANDDLSSYTFHLRKGVKFHNGKEFNAEDVLFTFNRLKDPVVDTTARVQFQSVQDIVALDDYTVRFDLDGPNGFFLDNLTIYQAAVLPANVDVERMTLEEFGTGAFKIEEYLPGERSVLVRNPDFWEEGKPYLDEMVFLGINEAVARAEALKSGDVDLVWRLEPQAVAGLEAHPDTLVLSVATSGNIGLTFDNTRPPFDNKLVRQAFQAATDRELINQAALLGLGTAANDHPIWPSDPRFSPQNAPPDYDPELAKSLLEQAGYPDGIDITLHTGDVGPGMIELAVAFQESAAPAGIRVEVKRQPADSFWSEVFMQEPFVIIYWGARPNPDAILTAGYHSGSAFNANRYFSDTVDELIERARGETLEEQKATYGEVQRILVDEVPGIVVAFQPLLYGLRSNVRGIIPHPLGRRIFQDAWLEE